MRNKIGTERYKVVRYGNILFGLNKSFKRYLNAAKLQPISKN